MFELFYHSYRQWDWPRRLYASAGSFVYTVLFFTGFSRSRRRWTGRAACCLIGAMGVTLSSCRSKLETLVARGENQRCATEQMQLTVTTSSSQMKTSEMLEVSIQVRHDARYRLEWPEMTGPWGGFLIFENHASPAQLEPDGWVSESRKLTLEPDLPGAVNLPGLLLQAHLLPDLIDAAQPPSSKEGNNKGQELRTLQIHSEPMTVQVVSVLDQADQQIRGIAGDDLPKPEGESPARMWALMIGNLSVVLIFLALGWSWRKKKNLEDYLGRAQLIDQWQQLSGLGASEMMQQMESRFVLLMEHMHGVKPCSRDFDGLLRFLNEVSCPLGVDLDQLQSVVCDFQQCYYSDGQCGQAEVQKLYLQLTGFLSESSGGKEAFE